METFETEALDHWYELDETAEKIVMVRKHIKKQKEKVDLENIENTTNGIQVFKYYHMKYHINCLKKDFWLVKRRRVQYDHDFFEISYRGNKTKEELKERAKYYEKKENYYDEKIHEYYGLCMEYTAKDNPDLGNEKRYLKHPDYPKDY